MREGIIIEVNAADRERLAAVVADRNSPQKHVWQARIILATAEGCGYDSAACARRRRSIRTGRRQWIVGSRLPCVGPRLLP